MEIEIKAKIKDFKSIRNRLKKFGAKKVGLTHQIDNYYLPHARKLTHSGRSILRTRYDELINKARLDYHYYIDKITGAENELEVLDIKILGRILNGLKCKKIATVEKKREIFKYKNMEIVLDNVKGLGKFMEIEIQGKNSKWAKEKIVRFYNKLGISEKQFVWKPRYHGMLMKRKGYKYHYFK